ncbi:Gfo/Idh/MocA family protein [Virgibacillus halophilus]|uniref:Gfo/Idh/MocA family oxidoreductase n=1 Tax=Tigheibacillus halophilus TaxID=361280 RepID=A0ABU5C437_9BACI|nr:Gfo/Idh/MocA family oxidoreductase [Virgibacillus halophilus]
MITAADSTITQAEKPKVNFAIAGCGTIARTHIEAIKLHPNAQLAALYSSNMEKATQWGKEFEVSCYTDYEKMLQSPAVDAVIILTPSGRHAEFGIPAARAGKHVIVEKPIDTTLEKSRQLIEACHQANVKLSCIFQHRFDEAIMALKHAIETEKLGPLHFGSSRTTWYRPQEYYDSGKWRGTMALDGGGALMNQAIHYIDLLLYTMGPVEEVHAYCATRAHERIEVEDIAAAVLKFKSGAIGMIEGNTAAYPGFETTLDVFGQNGSVRIVSDEVSEWHVKGEENEQKHTEAEVQAAAAGRDTQKNISVKSFVRQYADIVEAIVQDREPLVNGKEALNSLALILAIYQSAESGKPVALDAFARN